MSFSVAMTAHMSSSTSSVGILKFDDVQFSVGIRHLSAYKNTGTFVCEKKGLYLISSSILSTTNSAGYYIRMNGKLISSTKIWYNSNSPRMQLTGSIVIALQLLPNDSVSIYNPANYAISGGQWSTLTIMKVK